MSCGRRAANTPYCLTKPFNTMLTGFVSASNEDRENANESRTIALSNSPFQHHVRLTVSGFDYKRAQEDGKVDPKARLNPVLTTSVGDLFLSTLTRSRVDVDGHVLEPDGTFNAFVRKTIAENSTKTNGEILTAIVNGCKDKVLIVKRVPYAGLSKDGRRFGASLVKINFAD